MIELFRETVSNLQSAMSQIESVVDAPAFVNDPAYPRFRHEEKSQKTAIFLKGVRIVSALNASIALLERGHIQECSVLYRTIDEFLEDIVFLKPPGADEEPSEAQQKFLTEFYQEEFDTGKSPLSSTQKRHRVPRRTIYNAIAQITSAFLNTYDGRELHRTISQTMSGYVHGAYPHIMELYGGDPPHYHLEGMLGTPLFDSCMEQSKHYFYRGIQSVMILSQIFSQEAILAELYTLRTHFEKEAGLENEDEVEQMVARMKSEWP